MLAFLLTGQIAMFYFTFFSGKFDENTLLKVVTVGVGAWLLYALYFPLKQLIKNEPALIISKSEITITRRGKPDTWLWMQIQSWHIEKDKENSNWYLILETTEGKKSYSITWLEKSPAEIEELINELKSDYTITIVTHNMQQAARCSDYTAYMYLGELVEFGETDLIFMNPSKRETQDYITGRFG